MTTAQKVAVTGISAAVLAIAVPLYTTSEGGMVLESYRDSVGVWTNCAGHTGPDVIPGQRKTLDECRAILIKDFKHHNDGLVRCQPTPMPATVHAAALHFTLNVGVRAFCGSTLAAKLKAADWAGACNEYPRWVMAGNGRVDCRIRANDCYGLVGRRALEKSVCEGKLPSLGAIG